MTSVDPAPRDHRPDIYIDDDGTRIYRASYFGACDQYLVRVGLGQTPAPPPEFMLGKFDESAALEDEIIKRLVPLGWRALRPAELRESWGTTQELTGQLETELKVPGGVIRCHPDGVVKRYSKKVSESTELGEFRALEVKAMRKGSGNPLAKSANYRWQVAIEMASTKLKGLFVVGWKEDGKLTDDPLLVIEVDEPPYSRGEIVRRARDIDRQITEAEAGGGKLAGCTYSMWPCGFWQDHDPDDPLHRKDEVEELTEVDVELGAAVKTWREADRQIKQLTAKRDDAKKVVLGAFKARDIIGKRKVGDVVVTRSVEPTWKTDKEAAARDGVDLDRYKVPGNGKDYVQIEKGDG